MSVSLIQTQRDIIVNTIRNTAPGEWKVFVVDEQSRKLLDNVVNEDDILNENITNIEQIEDRRPMNKDMDVIYFLCPLPHIMDCLMADFERRRYRRTHLIWTSLLPGPVRERFERSAMAKEQTVLFKVLQIEFYPRESHLVTFRDPWSFPTLYHPSCNNLIRMHLEQLSQKIVSVCVALGEYPTIRYYRPKGQYEASVLCSHLARFVQEEIDRYAQFHEDFPPPSNRPRGALYIVDRTMDLMAPFLHEFTYQAMAHDLLPIKDGDKTTYKVLLNEGQPDEEEKEMEIGEKDKIWVENRHRHMKDTIEKLMGDFQKFIQENPHFTNSDGNANSLNAIKDMLAGLPQFQEMKGAYSLHLSMAQECMNIFQKRKLPDLASVEQTLATGLDEDYRKPKNMSDQVVRSLDDDSVSPPDRLRLLALYLLFKDGLLPSDLRLLLAHAQLPPQDGEVLGNLEFLGARVSKGLKDPKPQPQPLFPRKQPPPAAQEEYALSRYETALKQLLEEHIRGTLDQTAFPFTKPHTDAAAAADAAAIEQASASSLRSAKPTWAKSRLTSVEPRQRVIVFMAGGATHSEARACYEITQATSRDVFLATSHMLTPSLFMRQVGDLSVDKRKLCIPAEMPKPKAPAHLFEREEPPKPTPLVQKPLGLHPAPVAAPAAAGPPAAALGNLSLNAGGSRPGTANGDGKHEKGKGEKEKKKKHFFSRKH
ncbi:syntaxin-binding protein-like protein 2 [Saccharata proteae CBS 121410]|uniref:Syntaxin-binding protein-like protein 2 n=1 Tax=Saccharata proteae CBS 121410 TaxID=1314787 RepID=A0A9P4LV21_9PEZI|nr:syntaxin-binding protein-like protein 2 [Saccharata proteae CBS 121410]